MGPRATRMSHDNVISMKVEDMVGITAPLGFFDPFGYAAKADDATLSKYRECELKHGRIAMLGVLGFLTQERFHPFFQGKLSANPVKAFWEMPPAGAVQIIVFIGLLEYTAAEIVKANDDYKPGDYLGIGPRVQDPKDPAWVGMQNRELNNGRLAMFAILGEITHSCITGVGAFEGMNGHWWPN
jgi:hypothetical protein